MSKLNRLFDLAAKALDKGGDSRSAGNRQGSGDWRDLARSATEALGGGSRGDQPAASAPPAAPRAGMRPPAAYPPAAATRPAGPGLTPPQAGAASQADRAAIARYDYLMQTADPHQIEQIHREAFERLTPAQRAQIEQRMQSELTPNERPRSSSAPDLARAAARTEALHPGRLRGMLSRAGRGAAVVDVGGAALGVLGVVAGGAVLSSVAMPLLEQAAGFGVDFDAIAGSLDVDAIAGDALSGAGEAFGGAAEQIGGWGEQLSNFELPGLGDIFGR